MLKKIQTYLLENHPILWNTRIFPMAAILMGLHLLFFGIGYIFTDTRLIYTYYQHLEKAFGFLYFFCILTAVLLLIGWLIFYFRNNGFRALYPYRTSHLFSEWLLIFAIATGAVLLPYSMTKGYELKWKSVATEKEVKEALDVLYKVKLLIPEVLYYYNTNEGREFPEDFKYNFSEKINQPIPIPDSLGIKYDYKIYGDKLNYNAFEWEEHVYNKETGYYQPRMVGFKAPSLLFYKVVGDEDELSYDYWITKNYQTIKQDGEYIWFSCNDTTRTLYTYEIERIERNRQIKSWLKEERTDSIYALMESFAQLQQKHNLEIDLTPDQWMKRIYHPPYFPVNLSTAIYSSKREYNHAPDYRFPAIPAEILPAAKSTYIPYLQYEELVKGYQFIERFYKENIFLELFLLISCCISMAISMLVFSSRVTSGKHWLVALVTLGVSAFVIILLLVGIVITCEFNDREMFVFNYIAWFTLFIIPFLRILFKIKEKSQKGRSNVYLNIVLWYLPCLIPLTFFTYVTSTRFYDHYESDFWEHLVMNVFWINLLVMIPVMWLVARFVRAWKGLAEE